MKKVHWGKVYNPSSDVLGATKKKNGRSAEPYLALVCRVFIQDTDLARTINITLQYHVPGDPINIL